MVDAGPVAGQPHPRPPHRAQSARRGPRRPAPKSTRHEERRLRGGRGGPVRRHPLRSINSSERRFNVTVSLKNRERHVTNVSAIAVEAQVFKKVVLTETMALRAANVEIVITHNHVAPAVDEK